MGTALIAIAWIAASSDYSEPVKSEFYAQDAAKDFSKFKHDNPNHSRLPCLLCHRRETNAAQPTLPGKDKHTPCTGCHESEFSNRSSPICTICHSDVQAGTVKPFPALQSFGVTFDHAKHTTLGVGCGGCHRPARRGVALTIPARTTAHNGCFSCHGPQAKANGRDISSCGVCHRLGPFERASQNSIAFRRGFSHARHRGSTSLECVDCHRIPAGQKEVTAPVPLNHHAPARSFSCSSCHDGKKAFGGDDFSACTRCHKGVGWRF